MDNNLNLREDFSEKRIKEEYGLESASPLTLTGLEIDAKFSDTLQTYIETTLTIEEISKLFAIPKARLLNWYEKYNFEDLRQQYRQKFPENTVKKNTTMALMRHSKDTAEQLNLLGNKLIEEATKRLAESDLEEQIQIKDLISLALKAKELEAKMTGQISAPSTNVNITTNTVYKEFMEKGAEGFYGSEVTIDKLEVME